MTTSIARNASGARSSSSPISSTAPTGGGDSRPRHAPPGRRGARHRSPGVRACRRSGSWGLIDPETGRRLHVQTNSARLRSASRRPPLSATSRSGRRSIRCRSRASPPLDRPRLADRLRPLRRDPATAHRAARVRRAWSPHDVPCLLAAGFHRRPRCPACRLSPRPAHRGARPRSASPASTCWPRSRHAAPDGSATCRPAPSSAALVVSCSPSPSRPGCPDPKTAGHGRADPGHLGLYGRHRRRPRPASPRPSRPPANSPRRCRRGSSWAWSLSLPAPASSWRPPPIGPRSWRRSTASRPAAAPHTAADQPLAAGHQLGPGRRRQQEGSRGHRIDERRVTHHRGKRHVPVGLGQRRGGRRQGRRGQG